MCDKNGGALKNTKYKKHENEGDKKRGDKVVFSLFLLFRGLKKRGRLDGVKRGGVAKEIAR